MDRKERESTSFNLHKVTSPFARRQAFTVKTTDQATESPAISFDRVSKRYRVYRESVNGDSNHSFLRKVFRAGRTSDFWAVNDVSFTVARGEALGIIGHNGAGKSTILKLLYNITRPTRGEITIDGKL